MLAHILPCNIEAGLLAGALAYASMLVLVGDRVSIWWRGTTAHRWLHARLLAKLFGGQAW